MMLNYITKITFKPTGNTNYFV